MELLQPACLKNLRIIHLMYVQTQTDGALYWMITTGRSPMPSYKAALTDNQRWELVNYTTNSRKTHKK